MSKNPYNSHRVDEDGRDYTSLWDRCRGIVERGIKRYGTSGSLPISGTGRIRKKKIDRIKKSPTPCSPQHDCTNTTDNSHDSTKRPRTLD